MSSKRIKGLTIEFNGDTTKLQSSLKEVDSTLSKTQSSLRDVNKLLKLDPTNTELLKQKQELLNTAVVETKTRLEQLKDADKQAKAQLENGDLGKDQYDALQREIIETEQNLEKLQKAAKDVPSSFSANMTEISNKCGEIGSKLTSIGSTLTTHVTAPIAAVGAAAVAAFNEVDAGADIIVTKTGAAGDALDAMTESMNNIATTIPTDFETAGAAIGEVNTRFGLTGQALEELSTQFVEFAEINSTDVSTSVDEVQKVLEAFGLSATDASAMLDTMNVVGQNTGISMDTLAQSMVTNAAQLQQMGLSAYEAAGFLGQCEVSGADVSAVMTGLKKAMSNATGEGKTLQQALGEFDATMQSSVSDTDKLSAAYDLFGNRAGAALFNMCRGGAVSLADLAGSATDALGSVETTFNDTLDPIDQWQLTLNQLKVTGAELGNSLMAVLQPILERLAEAAKTLAEWFGGLTEGQQKMIVTIALVVAAIGPLITVIGGLFNVISTISSAISAISTGIGLLSGPVGWIMLAVAAVIAIGVALYQNWDTIKEKAGQLKDWIVEKWTALKDGVVNLFTAIKDKITGLWDAITTGIRNKVTAVKDAIVNGLQSAVDFVKSLPARFLEWGKDMIQNLINGIKSKITAVIDTVKNIGSTIKSFLGFSEPEKGPLSNFHTYGPDMMKLLASSMEANIPLVANAAQSAASAMMSGMSGAGLSGGNNTVSNLGGVQINVYGAEGQDVSALADQVSDRINQLVNQKGAVWA